MPPAKNNLSKSEIYQRYALGLARKMELPLERTGKARENLREKLLAELGKSGIKGWREKMTLYTRSLPAGCVECLEGRGSNLCVTGLCNRNCFFCFNPKPRIDETVVHGLTVSSFRDIPAVLIKRGIRSVGISGGEPLIFPDRVLSTIRELRREFASKIHIDLYTNGDLFTEGLLKSLREAGLDSLRINLAASGYNANCVSLALNFFQEVTVEMPVIPGHGERLKSVILELDSMGASHLILHELFSCAQNLDAMLRLGYKAKISSKDSKLMWGPVLDSEELILELLLYSLKETKKLSAYYCSCSTQNWIAEKSLERMDAKMPMMGS